MPSRVFMALPLLVLLPGAITGAGIEQTELFRGGEGAYHTYRIPALIVTKKGTLLAFCEGRKGSASDSGNIDLLLRRSFDSGRTWTPAQVVADFGDDTIGNPAPVVERKTGAIVLLLTRNPGHVTEAQMVDGTAGGTRTVWLSRSTDDGATWSAPVEITASVKRPEWTWYATGPGNGIQLSSGRLVVPCDHITLDEKAMHSHVIYSDNCGTDWRIGGVAGEKTNESAVVELRDGTLLLNMRSYHGRNRRAVAHSRDGGLTWSDTSLAEELIEPVCQASLIRLAPGSKNDGRLLFSNAAGVKRVRMTVKLSLDEGSTWPAARLVHEGPSGYSSLAVLRDKSIGLLYERGDTRYYERITFARFTLKWLTEVTK